MTRNRRPGAELRVGLLVLLALAIFAWLSVGVGGLQLGPSLEVQAVFDDAAGLVPDSAVKVAGVRVGSVLTLKVEKDQAVATLRLDPAAELRQDVRAEIRARSLLGEKYIALTPIGSQAPLLQSGDQIADTRPGIEIGKLVSQFGPLLANIDPDDMARLVQNLGELTAGMGKEAPELMTSLRSLVTKLDGAAEMLPEVKQELPLLLTDLRRLSWKLERSLQRADQMVANADVAAQAVPITTQKVNATLDQLSPGLDDLNRALEQSDEAVARLNKALTKLDGFNEESLRRLLREEGVLVRLRPQRTKN
ncbi:MAG: hypothetical protein CMP23_07830 [Rickettsiales bacterium]|nr:hypothetical protein [Rickettsiales bacterium]